MFDQFSGVGDFFREVFGENFLTSVRSITLVDIVDILLLSVFLFYIYRFIRARRAGTLAVGLGLVIAVLLLSVIFNMRAIRYILQNFYQVGLIAFIVIFQADLRAGLERVGTTSLKNFRPVSEADIRETEQMASVVAETAGKLSGSKVGALIVIERETKLGDYLSQGVIVNAELSSELLCNIFFDKAPLHDGAVIIRDNKLHAAGCYLPLSLADVNKELGTRHRAALGLSEQSDALVIVVSEETGTISAAMDGELTRNYNSVSLRALITDYMIAETGAVQRIGKGIRGIGTRRNSEKPEDK